MTSVQEGRREGSKKVEREGVRGRGKKERRRNKTSEPLNRGRTRERNLFRAGTSCTNGAEAKIKVCLFY